MTTEELAALRTAYDRTAARWRDGPTLVYDRLADALVAAVPGPLYRRLALDTGAGSGAATRALQERGARVVALDLSLPMLRANAAHRPPAVVGDIRSLPLRPDSVDLAVAACVISHVPDPDTALGELRRVTRAGGWIMASAFATRPPHPAKIAVEEVAKRFGYRPPPWYRVLKESYEVLVGTADGLSDVADRAGLSEAEVMETTVDLGHLSARQLAAWRLDMPHLGAFVADLPAGERRRLVDASRAALGNGMALWLPVLFLRARSG